MTINIFALNGDLNGKLVVVRFFLSDIYSDPYVSSSMSTKCISGADNVNGASMKKLRAFRG